MRIFVMFSILALSMATASGCKKAEEAADKAADQAAEGAKKAVDEAAAGAKKAAEGAAAAAKEGADKVADAAMGAASKETYIKAAVAIGCLGQTEKDKTQIGPKSLEIQKKFGFDATTWGEWAQKMAKDSDVTKQVADGLANCAK